MSENPTDLTAELVRLRKAATPGTWYAHDVDDAMFMSAYLVTTNPVDPDPINESNEVWSREVVCATLFQQFRVASHDACRWEHDAHFIAFAANNAHAIAAESAAKDARIAGLEADSAALREKLDACECSHADEEAAHKESLRMLESATARITQLEAEAAAMRAVIADLIDVAESGLRQWASHANDRVHYDESDEPCDMQDAPHAEGAFYRQCVKRVNAAKATLTESEARDG